MESNILKDCPHCGESKELLRMSKLTAMPENWFVHCPRCFYLQCGSKMAAIEAWNTRVGEDAMEAEIVRLRAENERLLRMIEKDAKI